MKRWHLTFGLTTLAVGAALLAPKLFARTAETKPTPQAAVPDEPVPDESVAVTVPALPLGHLIVEAGLDREAVLAGTSSERYLTITVTAPNDRGEAVRRPVDLSVVMDTSGSMSARGKIDQARRAAKLLAAEMEPGDTYALTVFNDDATVIVPAGAVTNPRNIGLAIDRIFESGGTNLYAGLERGKNQVMKVRRPGAAARVVVLSDGNANVGVIDDGSLLAFAAELAGDGVALSTIGLGLDYNEDLLARLADVGGGTYDFVDDASQLQSVFSDELARMASVVARNASVELRLPDGVTPIEVIGWDARPVGTGWNVYLGEVFAGETKKIVAKVRIDGRMPPALAGLVEVPYVDVVDGVNAIAKAEATVVVTRDERIANALDRRWAVEATRAVGSQYLDMSTRAYARGETERSIELAREGQRLLREQAAVLQDDSLALEASALDQVGKEFEMLTPSSDAGRALIKVNKERFRDLVR